MHTKQALHLPSNIVLMPQPHSQYFLQCLAQHVNNKSARLVTNFTRILEIHISELFVYIVH